MKALDGIYFALLSLLGVLLLGNLVSNGLFLPYKLPFCKAHTELRHVQMRSCRPITYPEAGLSSYFEGLTNYH